MCILNKYYFFFFFLKTPENHQQQQHRVFQYKFKLMDRPVCFSRMEAAIFTVYAVTTARVTWRPANRGQYAETRTVTHDQWHELLGNAFFFFLSLMFQDWLKKYTIH